MCKHHFLYTDCTKVCKECGIEHIVLRVDMYNVFAAPLNRGYNRRQRFKIKVDKLLGLHSGPQCQDPVWKHLDNRQLTLNNPFDVRECLRASKLKNKHYDNIRSFTDAFTSFKVAHDQTTIKSYLLKSFDDMFGRWISMNQDSFFSYAWLLRFFLEKIHSQLTVYLKPQTCKRRHAKYITKMASIQFAPCGETRNCELPNIHSPNEKSDSSSHHVQSHQPSHLALLEQLYFEGDHFQTEVGPQPSLVNKNSKERGGICS